MLNDLLRWAAENRYTGHSYVKEPGIAAALGIIAIARMLREALKIGNDPDNERRAHNEVKGAMETITAQLGERVAKLELKVDELHEEFVQRSVSGVAVLSEAEAREELDETAASLRKNRDALAEHVDVLMRQLDDLRLRFLMVFDERDALKAERDYLKRDCDELKVKHD
jgi:uncharacterized coiled-coil DUF342 family protein